VDLAEIGAGGGSRARIERGILRVGPESAGADPGPACYGLGGSEPTVTDANLVLGYLDAGFFLGGARRLDVAAATAAIETHVAKSLGVSVVDAAWGIHQLVTLNMEGAIRVVSIGRGKDPRSLACVTFGGAGPIHGARLARSLGVVRVPDIVEGDLKAMRNAAHVGERRLLELFHRYGADTMLASWDDILAHSEREMRAAISEVPAGRYAAEDFYDDCGRGTDPLRVFVTVIVEGDEITVDFDGSSPQTRSGMNSAFNYTLSYTWHAVKSALVQQTIPQNAGTMRPIKARAPEGSLFNPRPPAAAGGRAVMQQRIVDVILAALSQAVPERVIAASSHWANPIFEGHDARRGKRFVYYDIAVGGMGARPTKDGAEAVCGSFNLENIPVEVNESNYPIVIERLELIRDSSGAGTFRGSCGLRKDIRFLGASGSLSNLTDRHTFAPPGLRGGRPGALGATILNPDTEGAQVLHSKAIHPLAHGDLVSMRVSGSGGYGDPFARDPALVARDVALGYLSAERAREWYGVVVDPATGLADRVATGAPDSSRPAKENSA